MGSLVLPPPGTTYMLLCRSTETCAVTGCRACLPGMWCTAAVSLLVCGGNASREQPAGSVICGDSAAICVRNSSHGASSSGPPSVCHAAASVGTLATQSTAPLAGTTSEGAQPHASAATTATGLEKRVLSSAAAQNAMTTPPRLLRQARLFVGPARYWSTQACLPPCGWAWARSKGTLRQACGLLPG